MFKITLENIENMVTEAVNKFLSETRQYLIVKKKFNRPFTVNLNQGTKHLSNERNSRSNITLAKLHSFGEPVHSFLVNAGHMNGDEIHTITEKGIILIQNYKTKKLITFLIARRGQITRYWEQLNLDLPTDETFSYIMKFADLHKDMNMNNI